MPVSAIEIGLAPLWEDAFMACLTARFTRGTRADVTTPDTQTSASTAGNRSSAKFWLLLARLHQSRLRENIHLVDESVTSTLVSPTLPEWMLVQYQCGKIASGSEIYDIRCCLRRWRFPAWLVPRLAQLFLSSRSALICIKF